MTEAEWQASTDPTPMLRLTQGKVSDRKLRLYLVACCERIEELLIDARSRSALAYARCAADGQSDIREMEQKYNDARAAWGAASHAAGSRRFGVEEFERLCQKTHTGLGPENDVTLSDPLALAAAVVEVTSNPRLLWDSAGWVAYSAARAISLSVEDDKLYLCELGAHCELARDIFGNPFRPATLDPSWRTSTVLALAQGIYEERAFDRMPILADALEDGGCSDPQILNHCRGPGPHVRGCFVIDLILGKE
jgi:hypothetical protein